MGVSVLPPDVETHEGDAHAHDDEQGLQGHVVLDGLHGHSLHRGADVVVGLRVGQ